MIAHPGVRAARENWRAAVENVRVVVAWPDPQIMVTWFTDPIETRLGPQDWNATLSQTLPFPGKLDRAGEAAVKDADMARLALDRTVRDVAAQATASLHELWYIRQALTVAHGNAAILDDLSRISENAHADGTTTLTDVVKAQAQAGQVRYDLLLLSELEQTELTRLNGLLNREPDAAVGTVVIPEPPAMTRSPAELDTAAESSQEDILMAGKRAEKAQIMATSAKLQTLPDLRLGLFYAGIGDSDMTPPPEDSGRDAVGIQMGISVPLWLGKERGRVEKALAEARGAEAMKDDAVRQSRSRIHALHFKLRNAERLISLYRDDLLPRSLQSLNTAETWFREGKGGFTDITEARAVVYNFQLSLARARADYGKVLAEMEKLTGLPLFGQDTGGAS